MCGRYTLIADAETLAIEFELLDVTPFLSRRYNIAPTQDAPVVRVFNGRRQLATMRWSFLPSWANEPKPGPPLINARSETAATSPAFRAAFRRRRCIVPCSGFYEWKPVGDRPQSGSAASEPTTQVVGLPERAAASSEPTTQVVGLPERAAASSEPTTQVVGLPERAAAQDDSAKAADRPKNSRVPSQPSSGGKLLQGSLFDLPAAVENKPAEVASRRGKDKAPRQEKPPSPRKQPYLIRPRGGGLLALAGIWETWESRAGEVLDTFAILTTTPNRVMADLHSRMPVILDRSDYSRWLDPTLEDAGAIADLLKPCPDEKLDLLAVSERVNNVKFDDESCIAPLNA